MSAAFDQTLLHIHEVGKDNHPTLRTIDCSIGLLSGIFPMTLNG